MILDTPENLFLRYSSPQWKEAEKFYRSGTSCAPGRYELNHGVFAMVQEGITSSVEQVDFEAHRRFIDLQIVLEGTELLVWSPVLSLREKTSYCSEKDIQTFTGEGILIPMHAGLCYVMHPTDGHKACCHVDQQPKHYRKMVIKIPAISESA